jgi:hypothetical protein
MPTSKKEVRLVSCDNLANLCTKSLPFITFYKYVKDIDMRHLRICKVQGSLSEQIL